MIISKNKNILPHFTTIYHFVDKFYHFGSKNAMLPFFKLKPFFNKLLRN